MLERRYNKKKTIKSKVLDFVEKNGPSTFTDIQRFVVDMKYGKGAYEEKELVYCHLPNSEYKRVPKRIYRGHYTAAFGNGYFMQESGYGHLEKNGRKYIIVRNKQ